MATDSTDRYANWLAAKIDEALAAEGLTYAEAARDMGLTTHTLSNLRYARTANPRPGNIAMLEQILSWAPGSYWEVRNGGEPTLLPGSHVAIANATVSGELRAIGHETTSHGTLTWIEQPNGTRDYTLSMNLKGSKIQPSVSLHKSKLPPGEAAEEMAAGLRTVARFLLAAKNKKQRTT